MVKFGRKLWIYVLALSFVMGASANIGRKTINLIWPDKPYQLEICQDE
jgi:hypothetical protein